MKLRMLLQQRENEIMILLNMVNKKGGGNKGALLDNASSIGQPSGPILLREEKKEIHYPKYDKNEEDKNYEIQHVAIGRDGEVTNNLNNSGLSSN